MTDFGFLIDLFLNHKLPKVTREAVAQRIQMVEAAMAARANGIITPSSFTKPADLPPHIAAQPWPSTRNAMAQQQNAVGTQQIDVPPMPQRETPALPVTVIAQTPAAVAAMASRDRAIADSTSGRTDRTTGRPRKF